MNNTTQENQLELKIQNEWENASIGAYVITVVCTTWTICANFVILVCFYRNRKRSWTSFSRQTCSMTISDLLVGLITVPALVYERNGGRANGFVCIASGFLFFSTQCVTLYHVLGVCIYRNIKLKSVSETNTEKHEKLYTYLVIIGSWTTAFSVILCPFLIWSKYPNHTMLCDTEHIFGTNAERFARYLAIAYFFSQSLTNIFYAITCFRLWRVTRKTQPYKHDSQAIPIPSSSTCGLHTVSTIVHAQNISMPEPESRYLTDNKVTSGPNIDRSCPTRGVQVAGLRNIPSNTGPVLSTVKSQKRVTITIGILLFLFNVFTLPLTGGLFIARPETTSRDVRYVISTLFVVNSGINPIVYATRNSSLRQAMRSIISDIVTRIYRAN